MSPQTIVRLKITSVHLIPDAITGFVGLPCDRSWNIGEKRPKTTIVEQKNGWILNSCMPKSAMLETQLDELLNRLRPYQTRLKSLSETECVELSCVIYANSPPALNFGDAVIVELGQLGASLDIDLYLIPDEELKGAGSNGTAELMNREVGAQR